PFKTGRQTKARPGQAGPRRVGRLCHLRGKCSRVRRMFGLVSEARAVRARVQNLVRLNIELAKLEGKQKATSIGVAGGLGIAAVVLVFYGIGFGFATAAVGLNEAFPLWLSLLIVTVIILAIAALLGFLASRFARKAVPAKPAQAIEEAEQTITTLQSHV